MPRNTGKKKLDLNALERIQVPNYVSVYANNTNATSSFYEMRLYFGQIVHKPSGDPFIEDSVSVTMTWEHALRFRDLLNRMVESYKQGPHGTIRELEAKPSVSRKSKKQS